jgi:hypothetical protein
MICLHIYLCGYCLANAVGLLHSQSRAVDQFPLASIIYSALCLMSRKNLLFPLFLAVVGLQTGNGAIVHAGRVWRPATGEEGSADTGKGALRGKPRATNLRSRIDSGQVPHLHGIQIDA